MATDNKAPDFIKHTCPIRDACFAERDAKTLGADIRDKATATRLRLRHRKPRTHRTMPCGFEATCLEFCLKYRQWSGDAEVVNGQLALEM